ncbi:MAG: AAA family ATPase [Thermodesulfobacteriota bacterium]
MAVDFYGFSEKPFELTPDLKFLVPIRGFEQAMETVLKGLADRKGLILVTGEAGTGKTMLIHGVLKNLHGQAKSAFLFHSTFTYPELLEQIFREVGETVPGGEEEGLESLFSSYLNKLREQKEALVVFIDEAQKLSEIVGRKLLALMWSEKWVAEVLQLVLSGQPEFEEIFRPLVAQYHLRLPIIQVRLQPLTISESRNYIAHRLKTAGGSSTKLFTDQALSLIIEQAQGIPRRINILCDNALFLGKSNALKIIEEPAVREVISNLEGPEYPLRRSKRMSATHNSLRSPNRFPFREKPLLLCLAIIVLGVFFIPPQWIKTPSWNRSGPLKTYLAGLLKPFLPIEPENLSSSPPTPFTLKPGTTPSQEGLTQKSTPFPQVQVKRGDNLSKLITRHYGRFNISLADWIISHNPSIKNIDLLLINQKVLFPKLSDESLILLDENKLFRVYLGTYLSWSEAETRVQQIEGPALKPSIQIRKFSPEETWYRVQSGPFPNGEEALEFIRKLREKKRLPLLFSKLEGDHFLANPKRKKAWKNRSPFATDQELQRPPIEGVEE